MNFNIGTDIIKEFIFKVFLNLFILSALSSFSSESLTTDSLELDINNIERNSIDMLLALSDDFKDDDTKKALYYANNAYLLAKNNNDDKQVLHSMNKIAQIYWSISNYKVAMEYADNAKELAKDIGANKELATSLRISGMIFIDLNNYKKSSELFFNSLKLYEKVNDKEGIEMALSNIGLVNFHQLNFNKALEYFNKSLKMAEKSHNQKGVARGLNNVAAVYQALSNYQKATEYFEKANAINKRIGNKQNEAINNLNLGITFLSMQEFKKSLYYFEQSDSMFNKLNNTIMRIKCWIGFANYYFVTNNEGKSIEYANKALINAQMYNSKNLIYDATDILHNIYLELNDTIKAYKYLKLQYQTKDSLNIIENRINLSKLELDYEFEKKEQKLRLEEQQLKLYISLIIISLLIVIIVVILVLVNQRIKTKNALIEQQNLKHKLELRNKEITTNVMSLMKKNEMLSILSDKLVELKNKAVNKDVKTAVSKIAIELQKTADAEIYKEFEFRFNQIHVGFYDKLINEFPELSPSELRLCAFLRLNLSTKEISELTGQLPSSLETARYRLRKKLGISNTKENLTTFIAKI